MENKTWMIRDPIPNYNKNPRIGETGLNSSGSILDIIDYRDAKDIDLTIISITSDLSIHYHKRTSRWSCFEIGSPKSPYDKSVYGIGYLGEGIYDPKTHRKIYDRWRRMLDRAYNSEYKVIRPTYIGVTCDPYFHCFQNFAQWYLDNYYEFPNEETHLDKDILFKGNKIYSPNTCVFCPAYINTLFVNNKSDRGILPIGACYDKRNNNYMANIMIKKTHTYLGAFKDPIDAFYKYKDAKEAEIKRVANVYMYEKGGQYLPQFRDRLYPAMMNYKIEITD